MKDLGNEVDEFVAHVRADGFSAIFLQSPRVVCRCEKMQASKDEVLRPHPH